MTVFIGYALIALIIAGLLFYAVIALLPDGLQFRTERDDRPFELPADRRMVREDLDRLRIPVTLRGYRFAETDDLIDRLAAEIVVRDEEIARLRGQEERTDMDGAGTDRVSADRVSADRVGTDRAVPTAARDDEAHPERAERLERPDRRDV